MLSKILFCNTFSGQLGRLLHPDGLLLIDTGDEEELGHTADSASCQRPDIWCLLSGDVCQYATRFAGLQQGSSSSDLVCEQSLDTEK